MKITKRDIKVFLLGLLTFFLADAALNWESMVASFKQGYHEGRTGQPYDPPEGKPCP